MTRVFDFCGVKIMEHPLLAQPQPVIKLRPHVPVSDAFRAKMDAWLLETFGTHFVSYFLPEVNLLFVSPQMAGKIITECRP